MHWMHTGANDLADHVSDNSTLGHTYQHTDQVSNGKPDHLSYKAPNHFPDIISITVADRRTVRLPNAVSILVADRLS